MYSLPMNDPRARLLNDAPGRPGPVVYWMHREHRARDNDALLLAQRMAMEAGQPLCVLWCLAEHFPGAGLRQFDFLLRGMKRTEVILREHDIPFVLRRGDPGCEAAAFARAVGASALVTDFDPVRIKRHWMRDVLAAVDCPVWQVDGRNVVPAWLASDKREWMARTIRPKIHRQLPEFLVGHLELKAHPHPWPAGMLDTAAARGESATAGQKGSQGRDPETNGLAMGTAPVDWDNLLMFLDVDRTVCPVDWIRPGEGAALDALDAFVAGGLKRYAEQANDPNANAVSRLSPYLHFGMLSVRRAALAVMESGKDRESVDGFLEQLVVRRELAENFVLHTEKYDSVESFPDWAFRTLDDHKDDPRDYLYSLERFEEAKTHDPLWNAAQRQLLQTGYMHGYMRMYWAKKILEWSESPEAAMAIALYLNDRWQLDGRDPNGYAGVAWSIGGVHDQGWRERPVYGKIRYMNDRGAARKFRVGEYIRRYSGQPSLF